MLNVSAIMQQLKANATYGTVENLSTSVEVEQAAEAVGGFRKRQKATRVSSTRDVPRVLFKVGSVEVLFEVDELDPSSPRWVYRLTAGKTAMSGVVAGTANVLAAADLAHELSGLGQVKRDAPPTTLGNTPAPMSTKGSR